MSHPYPGSGPLTQVEAPAGLAVLALAEAEGRRRGDFEHECFYLGMLEVTVADVEMPLAAVLRLMGVGAHGGDPKQLVFFDSPAPVRPVRRSRVAAEALIKLGLHACRLPGRGTSRR